MFNLKKTFSKVVAVATACTFGVMTLNCTGTETRAERITVTVTAPDGTVQADSGDWDKMVAPLVIDLAPYEADGVRTTDPALLLEAERSVFHSPDGGTLVIVRTADGALAVDNANSTLPSSFEVTWSADLASIQIDTPDGLGVVELSGVPQEDRARMVGSLVASTLSLGDARFIHGGDSAEYVAPVVIIFGIVFGSWLLCVTLGVYICNSTCTTACVPNGVASAVMNCGVNITPGTGGGALGQCTCTCNPPPPTPTPTATPES